jgi:SagB-type dehydrogenase family enzyme
MPTIDPFFTWTELDRTTLPEWQERIIEAEAEALLAEPRSYPGYPTWTLRRYRPRLWPSLDTALRQRRCSRQLDSALPKQAILSRLLQFSHGITRSNHCGPVPSSGGLQAVELYVVNFESAWLPAGLYHYDRVAHALAQITTEARRTLWLKRVPSLGLVSSGALLWVLIGDAAKVVPKYGERGYRFLLLEAGHLMQNLCLLSASLGLCTVPLGGYIEREVARAFVLPEKDCVLYLGVCGTVFA